MKKKKVSFSWIQSNFYSRQSFRKFPLLSSLHRATDGALMGIVCAVGIMSTVALHAQYLWTLSFSRLEITRDLNRRFLESTAVLESNFLRSSLLPRNMVPTKARHLLYIDSPLVDTHPRQSEERSEIIKELLSLPITHGY